MVAFSNVDYFHLANTQVDDYEFRIRPIPEELYGDVRLRRPYSAVNGRTREWVFDLGRLCDTRDLTFIFANCYRKMKTTGFHAGYHPKQTGRRRRLRHS